MKMMFIFQEIRYSATFNISLQGAKKAEGRRNLILNNFRTLKVDMMTLSFILTWICNMGLYTWQISTTLKTYFFLYQAKRVQTWGNKPYTTNKRYRKTSCTQPLSFSFKNNLDIIIALKTRHTYTVWTLKLPSRSYPKCISHFNYSYVKLWPLCTKLISRAVKVAICVHACMWALKFYWFILKAYFPF